MLFKIKSSTRIDEFGLSRPILALLTCYNVDILVIIIEAQKHPRE